MLERIGTGCESAQQLVTELLRAGFPLDRFAQWPVTSIESSAALASGSVRSYCAVRCIGCCTDSVDLTEISALPVTLTPSLLQKVLAVADEFARRGVQALSTVRLNLFSGSNELDSPHCVELREILSSYLETRHGFPLGSVSSDLAFHLTGSPVFRRNLLGLLNRPELWDNICLSVDEQIPFQNQTHYERYLDHLRWLWEALRTVAQCKLQHAIPARNQTPRLILNMLIPGSGASFREEYRFLYSGGPLRATRFEQLVERYIAPFAGTVISTSEQRPAGHDFTTGIARLSAIPESAVYVAAGNYAVTGRGRKFLHARNQTNAVSTRTIKTKILPSAAGEFLFKACFAANLGAEDELETPAEEIPDWFETLRHCTIDVGSLKLASTQ